MVRVVELPGSPVDTVTPLRRYGGLVPGPRLASLPLPLGDEFILDSVEPLTISEALDPRETRVRRLLQVLNEQATLLPPHLDPGLVLDLTNVAAECESLRREWAPGSSASPLSRADPISR